MSALEFKFKSKDEIPADQQALQAGEVKKVIAGRVRAVTYHSFIISIFVFHFRVLRIFRGSRLHFSVSFPALLRGLILVI
jgi:hypothetical protein